MAVPFVASSPDPEVRGPQTRRNPVIDRNISYRAVHASRGKVVRAEPISALYEQKRVHHIGLFLELETQMCSFVPDNFDSSPDRVDALVWALTDLMVHREPIPNIRFLST